MANPGKRIDELRKLSVADRLRLVEDLWDGIVEDSSEETFPVSPEFAEELDRRLADLDANPDSAIPWEVVRDRIRRLSGGRSA